MPIRNSLFGRLSKRKVLWCGISMLKSPTSGSRSVCTSAGPLRFSIIIAMDSVFMGGAAGVCITGRGGMGSAERPGAG